jgi:RNA-directed DNA polymerase
VHLGSKRICEQYPNLHTRGIIGLREILNSDPARGHRFVRYADDLRVFVRIERAAQRVFESVCGVIERRLRLKVNREKSSVRHAAEATLLGFGFSLHGPHARIRADPNAVKRLKGRLRFLTRRNWSVSMEHRIDRINQFTTGWMACFRIADTGNLVRDTDRCCASLKTSTAASSGMSMCSQ